MALAAATLASSSPRVSISVSTAGNGMHSSSGLSVLFRAHRVLPGIYLQIHSQPQPRRMVTAVAAREEEGAGKTLVEEMRAAARRLHTKDKACEREKGLEGRSLNELEPNLEAYLRFLVDSKLIFQTLKNIVDRATVPCYAEFQNTGLERSEALKKDLKWFSKQGHTIPKPSSVDTRYASFLEELSEKDQQAFFCLLEVE